MATSIYVSAHDIYRLAHYAHWIPATRGMIAPFMAATFPGWTHNQLYGVIARSGLITAGHNDFSKRHLPWGVIGVEVDRAGNVTPDDGSSTSRARTESWTRNNGQRISEHLSVRTPFPRSVIVHLPHSSRLIPTAERPNLILSDSALRRELTASTDSWVATIASGLEAHRRDVTTATATLSRLVVDPERFPVGDPAEQWGRGVVYTSTATGRPLRAPLSADERSRYLEHHRLYTASMENLVDTTIASHGRTLIVDLHSYPVAPHRYENPERRRPEICIGIDQHHTPDALLTAALDAFSPTYDTAINEPYSGTYVPSRHYQSDTPVASIMIEIRRDMLRTSSKRRHIVAAIDTMLASASQQ